MLNFTSSIVMVPIVLYLLRTTQAGMKTSIRVEITYNQPKDRTSSDFFFSETSSEIRTKENSIEFLESSKDGSLSRGETM